MRSETVYAKFQSLLEFKQFMGSVTIYGKYDSLYEVRQFIRRKTVCKKV